MNRGASDAVEGTRNGCLAGLGGWRQAAELCGGRALGLSPLHRARPAANYSQSTTGSVSRGAAPIRNALGSTRSNAPVVPGGTTPSTLALRRTYSCARHTWSSGFATSDCTCLTSRAAIGSRATRAARWLTLATAWSGEVPSSRRRRGGGPGAGLASTVQHCAMRPASRIFSFSTTRPVMPTGLGRTTTKSLDRRRGCAL